MTYKCTKCHKLYKRDSTKAWIKSYCSQTGQEARLIKEKQQ
jgi:phage FluMu protein Com